MKLSRARLQSCKRLKRLSTLSDHTISLPRLAKRPKPLPTYPPLLRSLQRVPRRPFLSQILTIQSTCPKHHHLSQVLSNHFSTPALWKYFSVLMAQPFEVAKVILQTQVAQDYDVDESTPETLLPREDDASQFEEDEMRGYDEDAANSSDDEPNYFTATAPFEEDTKYPPRGRRRTPPRHHRNAANKPKAHQPHYRVQTKNSHSILDTMSALSSHSGAIALWRATNSTFAYSILSQTLEAFLRSFLGAVFGIADSDVLAPLAPGVLPNPTILAAATPAATVVISTAATAISALLLAPIDAARTRLILTPSSHEPRTLFGTLRTLSPAYIIPIHLAPITFLTSTIPTAISTYTPLFLRSNLNLDPVLNPTKWSVFTFMGSALDLSIRFPLETVLRRAQIATWTSPQYSPPSSLSRRKEVETIVPVPQSYTGIVPTMWSIIREEGYSESKRDKLAAAAGKAPRRKRKGQGVEGLYRGWKVGLWGLVGVWGASFMGGLRVGSETDASTIPVDVPLAHGSKF